MRVYDYTLKGYDEVVCVQMPFLIIKNDITKVKADALVNTANLKVTVGNGTDSAIS